MSSEADSLAGLSIFLRVPTRELVEKCFSSLFTHRYESFSVSLEALQRLSLGLSAEDTELLGLSASYLLRRVLYESSELGTVESVKALLPKGLDARLESLLSNVRSGGFSLSVPLLS